MIHDYAGDRRGSAAVEGQAHHHGGEGHAHRMERGPVRPRLAEFLQ